MNKELLWQFLKDIPTGMVVTYTDCANVLGNPNLRRYVGHLLHNNPSPDTIPCYKVVNSKGRLAPNFAFGGKDSQRELLESEGIVINNDFVNLPEYRYVPILETDRLKIRQIVKKDMVALKEILQDEKTMYAYLHAFSDEEVNIWYKNQLRRYKEDGFGLWAVCLKDDDFMIGQCGLTKQKTPNGEVIEVGYLFNRKYWHNGYATEAAKAVMEYGFKKGYDEIYSIIRDNNYSSLNVAKRNGLEEVGKMDKFYYGEVLPHLVYRRKNK